jgi:hypothetical protein
VVLVAADAAAGADFGDEESSYEVTPGWAEWPNFYLIWYDLRCDFVLFRC